MALRPLYVHFLRDILHKDSDEPHICHKMEQMNPTYAVKWIRHKKIHSITSAETLTYTLLTRKPRVV